MLCCAARDKTSLIHEKINRYFNTLIQVSFALEQNFDNFRLAGMRTLFKMYGKSGNCPRQFLVANCSRDLTGKEVKGNKLTDN